MPDDAMGSPAQAAMPPGVIVNDTFPADFRWVRRGIQKATHELAVRGVPREDVGTVEIVLAEALNNVVEHAYPESEPGDVTLVVRRRSASLIFEIRDKGRPMPKGRAPIGNHPMTEFHGEESMPEGGYGWFLIRELVRDLVYDRRDGENILFFRMNIEVPQA